MDYGVTFTLPSTTSSSPAAIYSQYTQAVTSSVATGNFSKTMQTHAQVFQNVSISSASLQFTTFTSETLQNGRSAPSSRPSQAARAATKKAATSDDSTRLIIIVVTVIVGFLLLVFLVQWYVRSNMPSITGPQKSPVGVPLPAGSPATIRSRRGSASLLPTLETFSMKVSHMVEVQDFVDLEKIPSPLGRQLHKPSHDFLISEIHQDIDSDHSLPLPEMPDMGEPGRFRRLSSAFNYYVEDTAVKGTSAVRKRPQSHEEHDMMVADV